MRRLLLAIPALLAAACGRTAPRSDPRLPVARTVGCPPGDSGRTGAGLFFVCSGSGTQVVILLHAFSLDHRMWTAQAAALGKSARVIAYDLRGHGRSAAAAAPYYATEDLASLMDHLRIGSAHLVGLSNGARIAIDFAIVSPARVTSLVLAGPGVGGWAGADPMTWMQPVIAAARAGDLGLAAELWAGTPIMLIEGNPAAAARVRALAIDNRDLWGVSRNPERQLDPPALGRLGSIRAPTLVVSGAADLDDLRRLADTLAQRIAGARLVVVPGAGHLVNMARPEAFNGILRDFLRPWLR